MAEDKKGRVMNNIIKINPSRLPINPEIAAKFGVSADQWRVLVQQIFPNAQSVESVMMALSYCKARGLDIYKKPVHIVPMWSSSLKKMVETVWPGIAEIRTTATRTGQYSGIDETEFGENTTKTFSGFMDNKKIEKTVTYPEWAAVTVYRLINGVRCPFRTRIFWAEAYATVGKTSVPNDMWTKRPFGQIDKCVEAAALRKAFPEEIGNIYSAEEMEGKIIEINSSNLFDTTDNRIKAPPPPDKKIEEADAGWDKIVHQYIDCIEGCTNKEQLAEVLSEAMAEMDGCPQIEWEKIEKTANEKRVKIIKMEENQL